MKISRDAQWGRIQGILEAFSLFNDTVEDIYTFTLHRIERLATVEASLDRHLALAVGASGLTLQPVSSAELQMTLERWLFRWLPNPRPQRIRSKQKLLRDEQLRKRSVAELLRLLQTLAHPGKIERLTFLPSISHGDEWEDFVWDDGESCYLLHLARNDFTHA